LKQEVIGNYATKGLKTIVYAYKDISYDEWEGLKERHNNFESPDDRHHLEHNLVFLAAFGL
jgi:magnesium-transporting ATPase (P-type)